MTFFNSEIVQKEMKEISDIQEEIYQKIYSFLTMDKDDKAKHIDMLENLLNKQRVLYTRMSLSEDPSAKEMKESIMSQAMQMGFPPDVDLSYVFSNMGRIVDNMKKSLKES